MLRNSASGPEIGLPGRILAGLLTGKHRNRPSGRPKAGRRAYFGAIPVAVRPKSGPEGRFTARKHYCVTWSTCPPPPPSNLAPSQPSPSNEASTIRLLEWRTIHFLGLLYISKSASSSSMLGGPAAPAGKICLPNCGAIRAPRFGR